MGAMAGILNQPYTAGQALTGAGRSPMASTATDNGSTDSSSSSSAGISANDFLTLLVTEMQNQDPTADTDPNEYINQLVQVNSLEQLIDINQNVSTALGDASSSSASADSARSTATAKPIALETKAAQGPQANPGSASWKSSVPNAIHDSVAQLAPGNLSAPAVNSAAQSVARALNGRIHAKAVASRLPGAQ